MKKELKCVSTRGMPLDTAFHPTNEILAVGTMEGLVSIYNFKGIEVESNLCFEDSIRSLAFNELNLLAMASKDKSVKFLDIESNEVVVNKKSAHKYPINKITPISDAVFATGDDNGIVKVWDIRQKSCVRSYNEHVEYISDILYENDTMLVTSGDGCLSIFDLKFRKPKQVSDNQDDELLAVKSMKGGKKAVVGTQSGVLLIFSWGDWGDCTDRYPGHPDSISALVKPNEQTIITGSGDGIIRAVGILPNQLLGTIGDNNGLPIESMKLSNDNRYLATTSIEQTVKIWDANIDGLDAEIFGDSDEDSKIQNSTDGGFFADLD